VVHVSIVSALCAPLVTVIVLVPARRQSAVSGSPTGLARVAIPGSLEFHVELAVQSNCDPSEDTQIAVKLCCDPTGWEGSVGEIVMLITVVWHASKADPVIPPWLAEMVTFPLPLHCTFCVEVRSDKVATLLSLAVQVDCFVILVVLPSV
jgi:hypothetical protein